MKASVRDPFTACDGVRLRPFAPADWPLAAELVCEAAPSGEVWAAIGGELGPLSGLRSAVPVFWALPTVLMTSGATSVFTNFDADPESRRCSVAPLFGKLPVPARADALLLYGRALVLAHPINKVDVLVDSRDGVLTEVLQEAGFVREATRGGIQLGAGRPVDVCSYGLMRSELEIALVSRRLPTVDGEAP